METRQLPVCYRVQLSQLLDHQPVAVHHQLSVAVLTAPHAVAVAAAAAPAAVKPCTQHVVTFLSYRALSII